MRSQSAPFFALRWLAAPLFFSALLAAPTVVAQEVVEEEPATKETIELSAENGKYQFTIDVTAAPDLKQWVEEKLSPVVTEWYPMIVHMLPSKDVEAPTKIQIRFADGVNVPAYASGDRITCSADWMRGQLEGEAIGAVVHEMVHVVQQYRGGRRGGEGGPRGMRPPGWLVEGIPDYIRWFLYEPETGGALIRGGAVDRARYDASYRTSANFLNWVADHYGTSLVPKLNARLRNREYTPEFWTEYTGKSVEELARDWKLALAATDAVAADEPVNQLSEKEQQAGWKLLFNGEDFNGWHTFKRDAVRSGWQVQDGELVCADPRRAGDLCTDDSFKAFELVLDYKISQGGNSGIIFHITNEGGATWATGPEFQLEDNLEAHDQVRCGWLYALYQPPADPDTAMPLDATLPAGQWNTIRLVISPEKCVHEVNGVKYFEYKRGSDEFNERVAASKFSQMPLYAKSGQGMIALQGDHGRVAFRNIKLRVIDP